MEQPNTLQQRSHRMHRWAAKDRESAKKSYLCLMAWVFMNSKESSKNKLFAPYHLGAFCSAKSPGQPTGAFIPTSLAYRNRERDAFLEILLLARETITIDFICWVSGSYSDGEHYEI